MRSTTKGASGRLPSAMRGILDDDSLPQISFAP
jgi:hypothetical protein